MNLVKKNYDSFLEKFYSEKKVILFFILEIIILIGFEVSFNYFSITKVGLLSLIVTGLLLISRKKIYQTVFVIISTFGIMFSILSPVFEVWDEPAHYTRASYITEGHLGLTNDKEKQIVSDDIKTLVDTSEYLTRHDKVLPNFFETRLWEYEHSENKSYEFRVPITNAYAFVSYIPSSLGLLVGKIVSNGNLGVMFYLGRIFNVLFFALCASIAVKVSQKWNKIIAFFALQPMVIYISSSFNQDAFSYGLLLIIFAYFVNLLQRKEKEIYLKDIIVYSFLCILMALSKLPYITLAGLLIFIPKEKFSKTKTFISAFLGMFVVIICGIFWILSYSKIIGNVPEPDVDMIKQIIHISKDPVSFFKLLLTNIIGTINKYNQLSNFAWDNQHAPELALVNLSLLVLPLTYPIPKYEKIAPITKLGVAIIALTTTALIYMSMYLTWDSVGSEVITGVQGRYFFGILLAAPIFANFSKSFGYSEEEEDNKNILIYIGIFLLIWSIASRLGTYY